MGGFSVRKIAYVVALVVAVVLCSLPAIAAVYPVGGESQARVQLRFMSEDVPVGTSIVRAGDTIEPPENPTARAEGLAFDRWGIGLFDMTPHIGAPLTDDEIAQIVEASHATADANNLYDVEVYAIFEDAHLVRFHQYPHAECVADASKAGIYSFTDYTAYEGGRFSMSLASASEGFVPIVEAGDVELVAWETYAPGAGADAAPQSSYATDAVVQDVTSTLDLYPKLSYGFWVTMDTGEGAPSMPSLFVQNAGDDTGVVALSSLATESSLAGDAYDPATGTYDPSYRGWKTGYALEGWYTDPGFAEGTKVTEDLTITGDITLHARWVARSNTPITVANMVEGPEGKIREGTYTFLDKYASTGKTDANPEARIYAGKTINGYHLNEAKTAESLANTTIAADGTTVVYVYYERDYWKVNWYNASGGSVNVAGRGGETYIKWGESASVYDPNSVAMGACYDNSTGVTNYNRGTYYVEGDSQKGACGVARTNPDGTKEYSDFPGIYRGTVANVSHGATVNMRFNTKSGTRYKYRTVYYLDPLPGQTIDRAKSISWVSNSNWVVRHIDDGYTTMSDLTCDLHWSDSTVHKRGYHTVATESTKGIKRDPHSPKYYWGEVGFAVSEYRARAYVYELRDSFTLSFVNTDGVVGSFDTRSHSVKYGDSLSKYIPAFEEGVTQRVSGGVSYVFAGWFTEPEAALDPTSEVSQSYRFDMNSLMGNASRTLYAGWSKVSYDVTYDACGGRFVDPPEGVASDDGSTLTYPGVVSGSLIARPLTPQRVIGSVEYTFSGWYKDPDYKTPCNFYTDTVGASNVTLYAKWVKGGFYNVTYHASDGTPTDVEDDTTYRYGSQVTVAGAPAADPAAGAGTFLGWSRVKQNASRIVGQTFTIASNTDLFAVYGTAMPDAAPTDVEATAPAVTLVSNYGSLPEGATPLTDEVSTSLQAARANATVTLPSQLTATVDGAAVTAGVTAYRLAGWNTAADGSGTTYAAGDAVAVANDTTLYASWERRLLSADAITGTRTYNGAAHEPAPAVRDAADDSLLARDTDYELSWSGNVHAGQATATATGIGEYAFADPVTVTFAIGRAPVTVVADDKSTTFGDPPAACTWSVASGAIAAGDDLGVTLACAVTAESAAGEYDITCSASATDDYDVTCRGGTYTVVAATDVAVSTQGWSGTYDGAPHGITVTPQLRGTTDVTVYYSTSELTEDNYATAGTTDRMAAGATATHAGDTTVWWWLVATGDQVDSKGGTATVSIARAPLVGTANNASVTYGQDAPNDGISWSGLVGADTPASINTSGVSYAYATRADGTGTDYAAGSPRGTYYIIPSGAASDDYDITYAPGTLTVTQRELALAWSGTDPAYTGQARHYEGATLDGVLASDAGRVTIGGYSGTTSATDVGDYVASVASLTGEAARNYLLPANEHTWHVTQAANSATVAIDSWTYGGANNEPTPTAGFGASTATFEYATSADGPFASELPVPDGGAYPAAGTYWVRCQIAETANWAAATSPATRFTIARRAATVTAVDETVTFGDAAPAYSATWSGLAPGESEADANDGLLELLCAYAPGSHVGTYEIEPTGVIARDNYTITLVPATLTVTQATNAWTTEPDAASKTYDGQPPVVTLPVAAFAGSGEPTVAYAEAGTDTWYPNAPVDAGDYVMRSSVEATDDYTGLSMEVSFTIERATWPDIPAADLTLAETRVRRVVSEGTATPVDDASGSVTIAGHDGSMPAEYSRDGGATWSDVADTGVIGGLVAGDVLLRHKADANHIESGITPVEVLYGISGNVTWDYNYLYPYKDPETGQTTMRSGVVNDTDTERSRAANLYLTRGGEVVEGYPVVVASTPAAGQTATGSYAIAGLSSHDTYAPSLKPTVAQEEGSTTQVESPSFTATQTGDDFAIAFTPPTGFFDGEWEIALTGADTDGHTEVQGLYVKVYWAPDDDSPTSDYAVVSQQASGPGELTAVTGEGAARLAHGSLPVWLYNSTGIPSRYRAVITGIVVDGVEFPCTQELMSAGAPSPMHWDDGRVVDGVVDPGPVNAPMSIIVSDLHVPMVVLDANGGAAPAAGDYILGAPSSGSYTVSRASIQAREPSWDNHVFEGWFFSAAHASSDALAADVSGLTQAVTLYAHWSENQAVPEGVGFAYPTAVTEGVDGHVSRDAAGAPVTNADAALTGLDDTMEWRMRASDGTYADSWSPVPAGATSVGGLGVGTYQVRRAATAAASDTWAKNASEPAEVTIVPKDIAATPAAPTLAQATPTSLTVVAEPGQAYSIDGGATWVMPADGATTVTFEGLTPGTDHAVVTRAAEKDALYPSDASAALDVTLPKLDIVVSEPPVPVQTTYTGEAFDLVVPVASLPEGCVRVEYSLDHATWGTDVPSRSDAGDFYVYVRYVGDATHSDYELPDALKATIERAANGWLTEPAIASWVAGQTSSEPVGQASFGETIFFYAAADALASADDADAFGPDKPSAPGSYVMRATVDETDNWLGLVALVPFEVYPDTLTYESGSILASGATPGYSGATGDEVLVADCGFTWTHHAFVGWNTKADGTGTSYAPGTPYKLTEGDDVLWAQWDPRGELAYDANGGSGTMPGAPGREGTSVTVASCGFGREGYEFTGWNTSADGRGQAYAPGDPFTLSLGGDVLFAQWKRTYCVVSFETGSAAAIADQRVAYGGQAERPRDPVLRGRSFEGWVDAATGKPFDFAMPVTRDLTLVARWGATNVMYRLYNPFSGEHFYTASAQERDAVAAAGWTYEGIGWTAPTRSTRPVFRLYNANAGDHHYTLNAAERDTIVRVGWTYEGVGWYSYDESGVAVWRQYNPYALAGAHNFTTDKREHVALVTAGWRGEGIAWYGV